MTAFPPPLLVACKAATKGACKHCPCSGPHEPTGRCTKRRTCEIWHMRSEICEFRPSQCVPVGEKRR